MSYRIGFGVDFHQLAQGRDLWLGGVKIPHNKGAMGHSDADVLLHAICDAMLGALALGDIGMHFPNTDPAFKNIDSKILLQRSYGLIKEKNYRLVNVDSSVCLEAPKIMKHSKEMRSIIASILEITVDDVSINVFGLNFSYLVPSGQGVSRNPLSNTLRFGLVLDLNDDGGGSTNE